MADKCFCHLNGLAVKDATARKDIVDLKATQERKTIRDKAVSLIAGNYKYIDCSIEAIPEETTLAGSHIFENCNILGALFVKGGVYEFHNCTFTTVKVVGTTAKFYGCTGEHINMIGDCHNSVIDGCVLTSTAYAPIILAGGNSQNVRIANNTVINNPPTGDFVYENLFQTECINTHGVSNSYIENNYCKTSKIVDTSGVANGGYAIDVSGHSSIVGDIRSYNNVVRNNVVVGEGCGITIYHAKDVICTGNTVDGAIYVNGYHVTEGEKDFGKIMLQGNVCAYFVYDISGNAKIKVYTIGNTTLDPGCAISLVSELPETAEVYYANNTQNSRIYTTEQKNAGIKLPNELVYVPMNAKVYIPPCYVVKSEISTVPEGTFFTGGLVANDTMADRYIAYQKTNTMKYPLWTQ